MLGADDLADDFVSAGKEVERVSCLGQCDRAPATLTEDMELATYGTRPRAVTPDDPELPLNLAGSCDTSFAQLAQAREIGPDRVIEELKVSGLQGRGGAGFPAHIKWSAVRQQPETELRHRRRRIR